MTRGRCLVIANEPAFHQIRRIAGEAGHVSYYVDVGTIEGGTRRLAFAGNIFVGPVVVTSRDEARQWDHDLIEDPRRFGEFVSSEWIRRFLDVWEDEGSDRRCSRQRFG